jgi:hypothetical protein
LLAINLFLIQNIAEAYTAPKFWLVLVFASFAISSTLSFNFKAIKHHIKENKLIFFFIAIGGFLVSLTFSLLHSKVLSVAIFGMAGRYLGFLTYLSFAVISIFSTTFSNRDLLKFIIYTGVGLETFFNFYGIFQSKNLDVVNVSKIASYSKVILTLGNPNFAGAVLGILITLSFSQIFAMQSMKRKLFFAINIVISFYVILLTHALQGILVSVIGITVFIVILFSNQIEKFLGTH